MQGRGKTKQRRTVRNGRLSHLWSPASHHSQPHPLAPPGGMARDHTGVHKHGLPGNGQRGGGGRGQWELGHTRVVTCTHDMRA